MFFLGHDVENIKLVEGERRNCERRNSTIVPEMVLFPNIHEYIYIDTYIHQLLKKYYRTSKIQPNQLQINQIYFVLDD